MGVQNSKRQRPYRELKPSLASLSTESDRKMEDDQKSHVMELDEDDFDDTLDDENDQSDDETSLLTANDKHANYRSTFSTQQHRITLAWKNLNVQAPTKKARFWLSGSVESGQLIAIMGASGSGKTTLLNVLTARNIQHFQVQGQVRVNGREVGRSITAVSAYVQQDDLFVGTLTVREHLVFQALLRLPKRLSRAEKMARVDEVIAELGLKKCANTRIGIPGVSKGISGGESKRLAFASEVLRNPPIFFCDEPTTGIDSFMAQSVVSTLKKLASKGKAILCTIHQPTSDVYAMFERVYFLAEGRVAFSGTTSDALDFFKQQGYKCPDDYNPGDFLIHTLAVVPGKEAECRDRIEHLCDEFEKSEYAEDVKNGNGHEEDDGLVVRIYSSFVARDLHRHF